tara:strand:- start:124 stop:582 length:459 start_codon:yes stop_codon:yes gene_type:complete
MPAGRYDITAEQGVTFKLHLLYKDCNDTAIDLNNFTSRMQVRRSSEDSNLILFVTGSTMNDVGVVHAGSLTGGGSTGEFDAGSGVAGTGDIKLNASNLGLTGNTGGILISLDAETMSKCPKGNHFYDLEIVTGETVSRILQGRFTVGREITR